MFIYLLLLIFPGLVVTLFRLRSFSHVIYGFGVRMWRVCGGIFSGSSSLSLFRFRVWMIYFSGFDFVFLLLPHSLTVSNERSWCFCAISLSFSFHCCLLTAHYIAACFVDSRFFFFFFFNYFFFFLVRFTFLLSFCNFAYQSGKGKRVFVLLHTLFAYVLMSMCVCVKRAPMLMMLILPLMMEPCSILHVVTCNCCCQAFCILYFT